MKKKNKAISIDPSEHFTDITSFSHYVTYDFHKLINKNSKKQNKDNFSDLQIYIYYLQGNFDKIEQLLSKHDINFDIIVLTETWNLTENVNFLFWPTNRLPKQ